jgi:uncharacterized membrane protein
VKAVRALLVAGHPFVVLAGLYLLTARWVALVLAALFLARWMIGWKAPVREPLLQLWVPAALIGCVLAVTVFSDDERVLLLTPAAINLALLAAFGRTLAGGPTLVETVARLQVPDLPPEEVRYCRSVTIVWCAFFTLNAALSTWLAFFSTPHAWAFYTGFLAYLLIGLLFACEFVVRSWRFGRYEGTVVAPLFRRIFPPPHRGASRS